MTPDFWHSHTDLLIIYIFTHEMEMNCERVTDFFFLHPGLKYQFFEGLTIKITLEKKFLRSEENFYLKVKNFWNFLIRCSTIWSIFVFFLEILVRRKWFFDEFREKNWTFRFDWEFSLFFLCHDRVHELLNGRAKKRNKYEKAHWIWSVVGRAKSPKNCGRVPVAFRTSNQSHQIVKGK